MIVDVQKGILHVASGNYFPYTTQNSVIFWNILYGVIVIQPSSTKEIRLFWSIIL